VTNSRRTSRCPV